MLFRVALVVTLSSPFIYAQAQDPALATSTEQPGKRLVADYDSGSKFLAPPYTYTAAQIPYSKITHIIHSGVGFDSDGNLQVPGQFIEPKLIPQAHAAGAKVLLLISGDVTGLEANPSAVPTLVANLKQFETTYGYDGLDLDWEYPEALQIPPSFLRLRRRFEAVSPARATCSRLMLLRGARPCTMRRTSRMSLTGSTS